MKKWMSWLLVAVLLLSLTACGEKKPDDTNTDEKPATSRAITDAEKAEIQTFLNDPANNGFLQSAYNAPEQASLYYAFYSGCGVGTFGTTDWTKEEKEDVLYYSHWDDYHTSPLKIKRTDVEQLVKEKLGVSLEDMATDLNNHFFFTNSSSRLFYMETYDAYYLMHDDTNFCSITVTDGAFDGNDGYRIEYTMDPTVPTDGVVVLKKTDSSFQFFSNALDSNVADTTGVPYLNMTAADLTDTQAKAILEVLVYRQYEIFQLGNVDWNLVDDTITHPESQWYALSTDSRFACAQDVRDFILRVYTGEQAEFQLDWFFGGEGFPEPGDNQKHPLFIDHNGKIYRCICAGERGLNISDYLFDTTRITARGKDTVSVEMYGEYRFDENGEYDKLYQFTLCKTADGWRLDNSFANGVFL